MANLDVGVVDLFCGVGGLSLGLRNSGLRVIAGIDIDESCRYAYEKNIGAKFISRDIADLKAEDLDRLFGRTRVRVLAACAPCQPFSGYTSKRRDLDNRWKLLLEVQRLVSSTLPEILTVENVPRLAKLPLWEKFIESLKVDGYSVSWGVLDSSQFGVPQRRLRLVLIASRLGTIELPNWSSRQISVRAAIGKLPRLDAGQVSSRDNLHAARGLTSVNLARIRASVQAGSWRKWPKKLRAQCHTKASGKTYPSVYGRMSWDKPSPTITTQFYGFGNGRFGHPEQDRAISLREGAILQSFPRTFSFFPQGEEANFRLTGMLIGNAVPPKLAAAIGRKIKAHAATVVSNSRNASASR